MRRCIGLGRYVASVTLLPRPGTDYGDKLVLESFDPGSMAATRAIMAADAYDLELGWCLRSVAGFVASAPCCRSFD